MGRRALSSEERKALETKKAVAARLQGIVEERCGTLSALKKQHPDIASTVKNWLPSQERWKKKPNGRDMSDWEWERVHIPGGVALIEFCNRFEARADYILFGDGAPYRNQDRSKAELVDDLAGRVAYELRQSEVIPADEPDGSVNGAAILQVAVDAAARYARELAAAVQEDGDSLAVRAVALSSLKHAPEDEQRTYRNVLKRHPAQMARTRELADMPRLVVTRATGDALAKVDRYNADGSLRR